MTRRSVIKRIVGGIVSGAVVFRTRRPEAVYVKFEPESIAELIAARFIRERERLFKHSWEQRSLGVALLLASNDLVWTPYYTEELATPMSWAPTDEKDAFAVAKGLVECGIDAHLSMLHEHAKSHQIILSKEYSCCLSEHAITNTTRSSQTMKIYTAFVRLPLEPTRVS